MKLQDKVAIITGAAQGSAPGQPRSLPNRARGWCWSTATASGWRRPRSELPVDAGKCSSRTPAMWPIRETARGAERMARETFGGVDILFNNAGVMTSGDFREVDEAAWDDVLNINLRGMYLMCRAVLPGMLERGRGAIVNTSSVMAVLTEPGYEAYTTSKAGIIGLTKALAVSYATQGIRVNCICPGWVDTPMNQRLAEELGGMETPHPDHPEAAAEWADALHA